MAIIQDTCEQLFKNIKRRTKIEIFPGSIYRLFSSSGDIKTLTNSGSHETVTQTHQILRTVFEWLKVVEQRALAFSDLNVMLFKLFAAFSCHDFLQNCTGCTHNFKAGNYKMAKKKNHK